MMLHIGGYNYNNCRLWPLFEFFVELLEFSLYLFIYLFLFSLKVQNNGRHCQDSMSRYWDMIYNVLQLKTAKDLFQIFKSNLQLSKKLQKGLRNT